jgi:hypothetical protein
MKSGLTMPKSRPSFDARLEIKRALYGLTFGLLAVPPLDFAVGRLLLGPYEGTAGGFFGTFYGDLVHGAPGAVALVIGPYSLVLLIRLTTHALKRIGD